MSRDYEDGWYCFQHAGLLQVTLTLMLGCSRSQCGSGVTGLCPQASLAPADNPADEETSRLMQSAALITKLGLAACLITQQGHWGVGTESSSVMQLLGPVQQQQEQPG